VGGNAVIPHNNSSWCPLYASLEVLAFGDVVIKEFEKEVTFFFLVPNDTPGELRVHEECLLASRGVSPDKWMN
jgi:hypothetical protein